MSVSHIYLQNCKLHEMALWTPQHMTASVHRCWIPMPCFNLCSFFSCINWGNFTMVELLTSHWHSQPVTKFWNTRLHHLALPTSQWFDCSSLTKSDYTCPFGCHFTYLSWTGEMAEMRLTIWKQTSFISFPGSKYWLLIWRLFQTHVTDCVMLAVTCLETSEKSVYTGFYGIVGVYVCTIECMLMCVSSWWSGDSFALASETPHGRSLLVYQDRKEGRVKNNAM